MSKERFQILSLSGGGYRGLYTASVLAALEKDLGRSIGAAFDLITGTSIGAVNDVGHATRGRRALECEERTAYFGRHFMDCIVRLSGRVIAVKRVPVYVKAPTFNKTLPAKPWYRRFVRRH